MKANIYNFMNWNWKDLRSQKQNNV